MYGPEAEAADRVSGQHQHPTEPIEEARKRAAKLLDDRLLAGGRECRAIALRPHEARLIIDALYGTAGRTLMLPSPV